MKTNYLILASIMTVLLFIGCSKTEQETKEVPQDQSAVEQTAGQASEGAQSEATGEGTMTESAEEMAPTVDDSAAQMGSGEEGEEAATSETSASETMPAADEKAEEGAE